MKTYIALALLFIFSGCEHSEEHTVANTVTSSTGNPADSDPMYLRAVGTRNSAICSWPEGIPKVKTFRSLLPAGLGFEKLMREKIEIVRRENADMYSDEGKPQSAKELDSLFTPEANAESKREEKYRHWDFAASDFYSDQERFDRSEDGMKNATDKMNNALRLFHDDRQYYDKLTNQQIDEYVAVYAGYFRQDCEAYLTLAKTLATRDEKLPKLRGESKKPWLNPRFHLLCAISKTAGCTE